MTTLQKSIVALFGVAALLGGIAFFGFSPFLKTIVMQSLGSPTGSTFGTAKVAEVVIAPVTNAATSTSLLNTDASARVIDSGFVSCGTTTQSVTGNNPPATGLANWTWQFATTAVANTGLQGNTNYAMNMIVPTSTTDYSYVASSSPTVLNINRIWPAGVYLTLETNATTSNNLSATCQVGVYYHGS